MDRDKTVFMPVLAGLYTTYGMIDSITLFRGLFTLRCAVRDTLATGPTATVCIASYKLCYYAIDTSIDSSATCGPFGCANGGTCRAPDDCDCSPGWTGPTCNTAGMKLPLAML